MDETRAANETAETLEGSAAGDGDSGTRPDIPRRRLLIAVVGACGGAAAAAIGVPALGMFIGPMLGRTPETWRAVGAVERFTVGETVQVTFESVSPVPWSGITAKTAAWLRRMSESEFVAFAVNCTHLGCPVRWEAQADLFLCPCHGGTYYADGSVGAGPPPRALDRYAVRIRAGQVEVEASALPVQ